MNDDSPFLHSSKLLTDCYDTHVSNPWVEENHFLSLPPSHTELPSFSQAREALPAPFWADHAAAVACYWRAWELAFSNLKCPTSENDFVANYCDSAFNGNLFMCGFIVHYVLRSIWAESIQLSADSRQFLSETAHRWVYLP